MTPSKVSSPALASRLIARHRLRRIGVWLAGILAFIAVAGFLVAPPIVRSQAEKILARELGRVATIEQVAINPFTLSMTVTGFKLLEADGSQPFVSFDELQVRASYASLLRLAPVVDAVRLTAPHVRIARTAADRFNFSDIQERLAAARPPDAPEAPDEPARFAIYNIELHRGRVDIDDRFVARRHELADIELGLPFISSLDAHREVFVEPHFSAKVNGAPVEAVAKSQPFAPASDSTLGLVLHDFDLAPLVVYAPTRLPVKLSSARLDLDLDITFSQPPGQAPTIVIAGRTELKSVAADQPGGEPLLRVASLAAEISAVEPLAGRYELKDVTVRSPEVWVRRDKGGDFPGLALLAAPAPAPAAARAGVPASAQASASASASGAAPARAPAPAQPLRYRLDTLGVEGGLVHWLDERGSRPIALELRDLRAELRNVSSAPGARFDFQLATSTDLKELLALDGQAALQPLEVAGKLRIDKLSLPRLWPLAEPFLAAELASGRLDAGLRFSYRGGDAEPHVALEGIEATLADVAMRQPGAKQEFLRLPRLELRDGAFDAVARRVSLGEIVSKGLRLSALRGSDGTVDLQALLPAAPAAAASPAAAVEAAPPASPWLVELRSAAIDDYAVRVDDRTRPEAFTWSLERVAVTLRNVSTAPGATAALAAKAVVNGKGTLAASGPFGIDPPTARLDVEVRDLDIVPVQRFIDDLVKVSLTAGRLSTRGKLRVDAAPGQPLRAGYAGQIELDDFASLDKASRQDLLRWKSLAIGGIDFELEPLKVHAGEVALSDFYSRLVLNQDGRLNLQNLRDDEAPQAGEAPAAGAAAQGAAQRSASAPAPAASAAPAASGPAPDLRIGRITLQGGNINFSDFYVKPNYSANLTGIGGSVTEMTPRKAADVDLRGTVDHTAPIEIAGRLNPLAEELFLDIEAKASDIELHGLSPYSIKYAGYGIEKGKLSVTLDYLIENRQLTAQNKVYLDQLTFGDKVESPTATQLPVLLAVSLLQDRNGVIDIELPISGSLDDPQFSVAGLIGRVIVNLLTKIITAPFSALAAAIGGGEELSHVEFVAGEATLDEGSRKRLDSLAKALGERPALKLDVSGRADAAGDRAALQQAELDRRLKAEKMKQLARAGKAPASIDEVGVGAEEYPALLAAAYADAKLAKPRDAGAKGLPVPEMEKLMLASVPVSDDDLLQLAGRRAQVAKDYLVETGQVPAGRVFRVAPKLVVGTPKDGGKPARAEFALR